MTAEIIALFAGLGVIALIFVFTLANSSPPTPTGPRVMRAVFRLLPRRLPEGAIVELGSGWGGLAIRLAENYPNHDVEGLEVSPLPWLVARLRTLGGSRNVRFRYGDFMRRDLSGAALVVCYLAGPQMRKLAPKLAAEMRPGTLVLSHTFQLPGWRPADTVIADDIYQSPVYLYEVPDQTPDQASGAVAVSSQDATGAGSDGNKASNTRA